MPEKVLNFFVSIVNTIGVPVIMIGTPKALSILQNEFQQAKRDSGQGDALWERMKNDTAWNIFRKAIWTYQYTRQKVPYSRGLKNALYDESQGIPFLAVHIYKLTQEDAILSGRESFTTKDMKRIASEKMGLTKPMREALKAGKDVDLMQYVDITPFSYSSYCDNYSIAAEAAAPASAPPEEKTVQEAATIILIGLGLTHAQASTLVCSVLAADEKSRCPAAPLIAQKAYQLYLANPSKNEAEDSSPLMGLCGYDSLKKTGVIDDGTT